MTSALSIRAHARRFIDAKISERLSPKTIDFYCINLSHFAGFFPSKKPLAELTRQDIRAFLAFVISEKSAHVGDACYRSVLALFNWLEEEEEITDNPFYRGRQHHPAAGAAGGKSSCDRDRYRAGDYVGGEDPSL